MGTVIATNGLKDLCLRKDLLGKKNLDWKSLEAAVLSRGVEEESSALLEQPLSATIKEEIAEAKRREYESRIPHSFCVHVGPSLLRRNCKHLALLPERVSPGVIREEHPKRELTPETGVPEPGWKGSPVSRERSQENHDPGDLGSAGEETQGN